jgi:hypothetical protein
MRNNYCFSTATIVTQARLIATFVCPLLVSLYFVLVSFRILFHAIHFGKLLVATHVKSLGKAPLFFMSSFNKNLNMKGKFSKNKWVLNSMNIPMVAAVNTLHADWHSRAVRIVAAYHCQCARLCTGDKVTNGRSKNFLKNFVTFCKVGDTNGRCKRGDFDEWATFMDPTCIQTPHPFLTANWSLVMRLATHIQPRFVVPVLHVAAHDFHSLQYKQLLRSQKLELKGVYTVWQQLLLSLKYTRHKKMSGPQKHSKTFLRWHW